VSLFYIKYFDLFNWPCCKSLARRIGVRPFHCIGAWRNDHDSTSTVPGDGVIGWVAVIGAIGRELADRRVDLVEQHLQL
jgi:hypothetical protein